MACSRTRTWWCLFITTTLVVYHHNPCDGFVPVTRTISSAPSSSSSWRLRKTTPHRHFMVIPTVSSSSPVPKNKSTDDEMMILNDTNGLPTNDGDDMDDDVTACIETRTSHPVNHNHDASLTASFPNGQPSVTPTKINYHWTRQNLALALPAWMGLLADPMLGLVDTAFVARIGSVELAALGVCTSIYGMAFAVFHASTMATTSLVASAKSKPEQQHITLLSLQLALFLGVTVLLGLRFGGSWALSCLGVGHDSLLYQPARQYLLTRCWAAPAVLSLVVADGAFRGVGNTRIPLIASVTAALINLVLDPILMFRFGYGVRGAAAATAIAQYGAVAVYAYFLKKRNMLPVPKLSQRFVNNRNKSHRQQQQELQNGEATSEPTFQAGKVLRTILGANLSMLAKQGSLLVFYTYAAALATGFGVSHVAAHQVGLSLWLLFTWWLDAASVSGQVLMSRTYAEQDLPKVKSLTRYMILWALGQGVVSTLGMMLASNVLLPRFIKPEPSVQAHLMQLLPQLTMQQTLISLVLVLESLVIGGKQFYWMATGTTVCTLLAATRLHRSTSVVTIWSQGFFTLFVARLISGMIGTMRVIQATARATAKNKEKKQKQTVSDKMKWLWQ